MILVMTSKLYLELAKNEPKFIEDCILYRWDSYISNDALNTVVLSMNNFLPNMNLNVTPIDKVFDIAYANWFLSNENAVTSMIVMAHYIISGNVVVILVNSEEDTNPRELLNSYLKLFQQRYGITARDIKDLSDIPLTPKDQDAFSINGLYYYNLDRPLLLKYINSLAENPALREQLKKTLDEAASEL